MLYPLRMLREFLQHKGFSFIAVILQSCRAFSDKDPSAVCHGIVQMIQCFLPRFKAKVSQVTAGAYSIAPAVKLTFSSGSGFREPGLHGLPAGYLSLK